MFKKTDNVKVRFLGSTLIVTIPIKILRESKLKSGDILYNWEEFTDDNSLECIGARIKRKEPLEDSQDKIPARETPSTNKEQEEDY